jgi:hypothetical protein
LSFIILAYYYGLYFSYYLVNEVENIKKNSKEELIIDRDGYTLEDFGFKHFLKNITKDYFSPLISKLYGTNASHINSFIVKYEMNGDREHFLHSDGSEYTLNICLGADFEGN